MASLLEEFGVSLADDTVSPVQPKTSLLEEFGVELNANHPGRPEAPEVPPRQKVKPSYQRDSASDNPPVPPIEIGTVAGLQPDPPPVIINGNGTTFAGSVRPRAPDFNQPAPAVSATPVVNNEEKEPSWMTPGVDAPSIKPPPDIDRDLQNAPEYGVPPGYNEAIGERSRRGEASERGKRIDQKLKDKAFELATDTKSEYGRYGIPAKEDQEKFKAAAEKLSDDLGGIDLNLASQEFSKITRLYRLAAEAAGDVDTSVDGVRKHLPRVADIGDPSVDSAISIAATVGEEDREQFLEILADYYKRRGPPPKRTYSEKMATAVNRGSKMPMESIMGFLWDNVMPDSIAKDIDFGRQILAIQRGEERLESDSLLGQGMLLAAQMAPAVAASGGAGVLAEGVGGSAAGGATLFWYSQTYDSLRQDLIASGVDRETARTASTFAALPIAAIETIQVKGLFPWLNKETAATLKEAVAKGTKHYLKAATKKHAAAYFKEFGEEVVQGVMDLATKAVADKFSATDPNRDWAAEIENFKSGLWDAAISLPILMGPGVAIQAASDVGNIIDRNERAGAIKKLKEAWESQAQAGGAEVPVAKPGAPVVAPIAPPAQPTETTAKVPTVSDIQPVTDTTTPATPERTMKEAPVGPEKADVPPSVAPTAAQKVATKNADGSFASRVNKDGTPAVPGQAGVRLPSHDSPINDINSHQDYIKNGGWKLHLDVSPENQSAVDEWLASNHSGAYKLGAGGDANGGEAFTVYVGGRAETDDLVRRIESEIGDLLNEHPAKNSERHKDTMLGNKVAGRYDLQDATDAPMGARHEGLSGLPETDEITNYTTFGSSTEGGENGQNLDRSVEADRHRERVAAEIALHPVHGPRLTGKPAAKSHKPGSKVTYTPFGRIGQPAKASKGITGTIVERKANGSYSVDFPAGTTADGKAYPAHRQVVPASDLTPKRRLGDRKKIAEPVAAPPAIERAPESMPEATPVPPRKGKMSDLSKSQRRKARSHMKSHGLKNWDVELDDNGTVVAVNRRGPDGIVHRIVFTDEVNVNEQAAKLSSGGEIKPGSTYRTAASYKLTPGDASGGDAGLTSLITLSDLAGPGSTLHEAKHEAWALGQATDEEIEALDREFEAATPHPLTGAISQDNIKASSEERLGDVKLTDKEKEVIDNVWDSDYLSESEKGKWGSGQSLSPEEKLERLTREWKLYREEAGARDVEWWADSWKETERKLKNERAKARDGEKSRFEPALLAAATARRQIVNILRRLLARLRDLAIKLAGVADKYGDPVVAKSISSALKSSGAARVTADVVAKRLGSGEVSQRPANVKRGFARQGAFMRNEMTGRTKTDVPQLTQNVAVILSRPNEFSATIPPKPEGINSREARGFILEHIRKFLQEHSRIKPIVPAGVDATEEKGFNQAVDGIAKATAAELDAYESLLNNTGEKVKSFYDEDIVRLTNPRLQEWHEKRYGKPATREEVAYIHLLSSFASGESTPRMDTRTGMQLYDEYKRTGRATGFVTAPKGVYALPPGGKTKKPLYIDRRTGAKTFESEGNKPLVDKNRRGQLTHTMNTSGLDAFNQLIDYFGGPGSPDSLREAIDWVGSQHTFYETTQVIGRQRAKKLKDHEYFSRNSDHKSFGIFALSNNPKHGAYVLNRWQNLNFITKDMWVARAMSRYFGEDISDRPWKTTKDGLSRRRALEVAWRRVARERGMTPAGVQERMWSLEKRLYNILGHNEPEAYTSDGVPDGDLKIADSGPFKRSAPLVVDSSGYNVDEHGRRMNASKTRYLSPDRKAKALKEAPPVPDRPRRIHTATRERRRQLGATAENVLAQTDSFSASIVSNAEKNPRVQSVADAAVAGDENALKTLVKLTRTYVSGILDKIPGIKYDITPSMGLWGGYYEPSFGLTVDYNDATQPAVLAAIKKLAGDFKQAEVHRRAPANTSEIGTAGKDGSHVVPSYSFKLDGSLTDEQVAKAINESGLPGATFAGRTISTYYVPAGGDYDNRELREEYVAGVERLRNGLGSAIESAEQSAARLWNYGEEVTTGRLAWPESTQHAEVSPESAEKFEAILKAWEKQAPAAREDAPDQDAESELAQTQQGPRKSDQPGIAFNQTKPDAAKYYGVHYSNSQLESLDGARFGKGIAGAEQARVAASEDARIRKRVYFYITNPGERLPTRERGLGTHAHAQTFDNILGPGDEMNRIWEAGGRNANGFESALLDAGYDGYARPDYGIMVVLGQDRVPVQYLGDQNQEEALAQVDRHGHADYGGLQKFSIGPIYPWSIVVRGETIHAFNGLTGEWLAGHPYNPEVKGSFSYAHDKAVAEAQEKLSNSSNTRSQPHDGDSYFKKRKVGGYKSRDTLIYISPSNFLKLAEEGESSDKAATVKSVIDSGKKFSDYPFLTFEHDGRGKAIVRGHEGRHRARALKAAGVKSMPVVLVSRSGKGMAIRWDQQSQPGIDRIDGQWPATLTSEDGKHVIPFPVSDPMGHDDALAQTNSDDFRQFYGKTPFKNDDGSPQVFYHGGIDPKIVKNKYRASSRGSLGYGFYLSPYTEDSQEYADAVTKSGRPGKLQPLYVRMEKPLTIEAERGTDPAVELLVKLGVDRAKADKMVEKAYDEHGYPGKEIMTRAKQQGYDGIVEYVHPFGNSGDWIIGQLVTWDTANLKSAAGDNSGKFDRSSNDILAQAVPTWRDGILDFLNNQKMARWTAKDFKGLIDRNRSLRAQAEVTGLDKMLDAKIASNEKVSADEVRKFIADNDFQIKDVTDVVHGPPVDGSADISKDQLVSEFRELIAKDPAEAEDVFGVDPSDAEGEIEEFTASLENSLGLSRARNKLNMIAGRKNTRRAPKFQIESQILPGPYRTYRELFVTAPRNNGQQYSPADTLRVRYFTSDDVKGGTGTEVNEFIGPVDGSKKKLGYVVTDAQGKVYGKPFWVNDSHYTVAYANATDYVPTVEAQLRKQLGVWKDGHSQYDDVKNPIVRVRFTERLGGSGRRVLMIEEIQGPSTGQQKVMPESLRDRIYEIGIRRMIRYAAEHGFDTIAWITGIQQADRNQLSTYIDALSYRKIPELDEYELTYYKDGYDYPVGDGDGIPEYELSEYVGKEVAEKIINGQGVSEGTPDDAKIAVEKAIAAWEKDAKSGARGIYGPGEINKIAGWMRHDPGAQFDILKEYGLTRKTLDNLNASGDKAPFRTLSGLDIAVGGEGLRRLYDSDIPARIGKEIKKYGGKIINVDINVSKKAGKEFSPFLWHENPPDVKRGEWARGVNEQMGGFITDPTKDWPEAIDRDAWPEAVDFNNYTPSKQPAFDLPRELIDAANNEGMSLFQAYKDPGDDKRASVAARDVIATFERIFNLPIKEGGFNSARAKRSSPIKGFYKWLRSLTQFGKSPRIARVTRAAVADIATAAHLVGTHINSEAKVARLLPPAEAAEARMLDYSIENRVNEGFAEFIRHYITGNDAPKLAPQLTSWFENTWMADPANKKFVDAIHEARKYVADFNNQSLFLRARSLIGTRGADDLSWKERKKRDLRSRGGEFMRDWIDQLHPLRVFEAAGREAGYTGIGAYKMAMAYAKTATSEAAMAFEDGVRSVLNGRQIGTTKLFGLSDLLNTNGEYDEAVNYAYARFTLHMASIKPGYNTGMTIGMARDIVDYVRQDADQHGRYEKFADGITQFNRDLIDMLVDAGAMPTALRDKIVAMYGNQYFPLHRAADGGMYGGGNARFVNLDFGVKRRSNDGSGERIIDPIDATINMAVQYYGLAMRYQVGLEMARMSDPAVGGINSVAGMGGAMDRIDPKMVLTRGTVREILNKLVADGVVHPDDARAMMIARRIRLGKDPGKRNLKWFARRHGITGNRVRRKTVYPKRLMLNAARSEADVESTVSLWKSDYTPNSARATVRINMPDGKPVMYQMDRDLYEAVIGMHALHFKGLLLPMLHSASKAMKTGAVGINTLFGGMNPVRDFFEYQGRAEEVEGANSITEPVRLGWRYLVYKAREHAGLPHNDALSRLYDETGGKVYSPISHDVPSRVRVREKRFRKKITASKAVNPRTWVSGVLNTIGGIQEMIAISDAPPRLAEMLAVINKAGYKPVGAEWHNIATNQPAQLPQHVRVSAVNAALEATVNFKRVGARGQVVEAFLPFFNPTVQAEYRQVRQIKRLGNRSTQHDRAKNARTLIYWASLASFETLHWLLKKDDERYNDASTDEREKFWLFDILGGIGIPKPRDAMIIANLTEAALDAAFKPGEKLAPIDVIKRDLLRRFPAGGGLLRGAAELWADWDMYHDRPLTPDWLKGKAITEQATPYTLEASRKVSRAIPRWFPRWARLSPIQIEHLANSATGGAYARQFGFAEDAAGGRLTPRDIPFIGGFSRPQRYTQAVDDFYREKVILSEKVKQDEADGHLNKKELSRMIMLDEYEGLMADIRKLDTIDAAGRRTHEVDSYINGLAREALGRPASETSPTPFDRQAPAGIRKEAEKFITARVERAILSKGMPVNPRAGEPLDEALEQWNRRRQADVIWLREHRDLDMVTKILDNVRNGDDYRRLLMGPGKRAAGDVRQWKAWNQRVINARKWLND